MPPTPVRPPRRVVTGIDANGQSGILIDGPSPKVVWTTDTSPADNAGTADAGGGSFSFDIPDGGSTLFYTDLPPASEGAAIGMHATDTLDYGVVLSGRITLITETGEAHLEPGDIIVDRGVLHAWRNPGPDACRILFVFLPAMPVGGRTA